MSDKTDLTIEIFYSCPGCGLKKIGVRVKARGNEAVMVWMKTMEKALADDHARRSPHCHPETLSEVMIPVGHADRVGGASVQ